MIFRPASFRPTSGRVLAVAGAVLSLGALAGFVAAGDWAGLLRYGWVPLLIGVLAWVLFWLPEVRVEEHAVTVRNPFRTVHIPWSAIQVVDTKYSLTLHTSDGVISAWAAPAPGRYSVASTSKEDGRIVARTALGPQGTVRPGDLPRSASGAAAYLIRTRLEQLREDGAFDALAAPHRTRTEYHRVTIAVLAGLVVASVLGALL